jgi:hypothetical protein
MGVTAYLFEIRQIQSYVFATGKLRDASGASELIDAISGDGGADIAGLAGRIIAGLKLPHGSLRTYRAAGGVLDFCCDDAGAVARFRAALRLGLAGHAPGLVFGDSVATGADDATARVAARKAMPLAGPVRGVGLPLGSPLVRPAPRSGGSPAAARGWTDAQGRCAITGEYADLPTLACRDYQRRGGAVLASKFVAAADRPGLRWPDVFRADEDTGPDQAVFPFGENALQRIAVLHADGNGMGALYAAAVRQLGSADVRKLSQALTEATRAAVQTAMAPVVRARVDGVPPARPILLGGDDVTLILRADLAADFAVAFVQAYQDKATAAVCGFGVKVPDAEGKPTGADWPTMTTKVGFVVIGPNQPFAQAYRLAEDLAKAARDPGTSRIAFHRVAGAEIPDDADALAAQGRIASAPGLTLWRAAHGLDDFARLRSLADLLDDDDVGRGGLRKVPEALKSGVTEAKRLFDRAMDVIGKRNKDTRDALKGRLAALGFDGTFHPGTPDAPAWCPLLAAHDLAHVMRGQSE